MPKDTPDITMTNSSSSSSSAVRCNAPLHKENGEEQFGILQEQHSPPPPRCAPNRGISRGYSKPELDWTTLKQGTLYGRDQELTQLQQAFERRITGTKKSPELCLVAGKSGTGKSVLVTKALRELVEDHEGAFIVGKFDLLKTPEPYGPFVVALNQLVLVLQQTYHQSEEGGLRQLFLEQVGLEACYVLCSLLPVLGRILGLQQEPTSSNALSAQQDRLKIALAKMFRVVSSNDAPIVLVLDDLQWADTGSIRLLEDLVANKSSIEGLMVVGICRDNEVPWHHNFAGMLRRLEDEKGTRIFHIEVNNLPVVITNALVSDILRQPPQICLPLTEVIHAKTEGNVFFLLHYIKALYQEGVLVAEQAKQSMGEASDHHNNGGGQFQWLWNDDQWIGGFHTLDVTDLVAFQIKRLPDECQQLLKTASCLGAEFDSSMLSLVLNGNTDVVLSNGVDVMQALKLAVDEQMVVGQMHRPGKFAFAHDRYQQAANAMIPEEERAMSHVTIGRALYEGLTPKEMEDNLFLVVNQMILGIPLLSSEVDKNGLASLAFHAGAKASRASDFESALTFFQTGASLLGQRHWRDEYHLSLELYNSLAEAHSACGSFESMDIIVREILANCRSPSDEIRPQITRIRALTSRLHFAEALQEGLQLLSSLGEPFPSKPRVTYLIYDLVKVKRRLKGKSDQDLLNLPTIDNTTKKAAMRVLQMLAASAFCGNPEYFALILLRAVKITLKYGLSDSSAFAFSHYGMVLCALGEFDEAYRYGQLGMRLLDQNEVARVETFPRVSFIVHQAINMWTQPIKLCLAASPVGIAAAMDSGDFECAVYSAYSYCMNAYLGGESLPVIVDRLEQYLEFIRHCKQGPWLALAFLTRRFFLNLMGKTDNPLMLDLQSEEHETLCTATMDDKFSFQLQETTLAVHRLVLAYHLGEVDLAVACRKGVRSFEKEVKSTTFVTFYYFYDGMTSLEAAYFGKRTKRMSSARTMLKKLQPIAVKQKHFSCMVSLLQAEIESLKKNTNRALDLYEKAMQQATDEGANQFLALAYERASVMQSRIGCRVEAQKLMKVAVDRYDDWGAMAISANLRGKHNV